MGKEKKNLIIKTSWLWTFTKHWHPWVYNLLIYEWQQAIQPRNPARGQVDPRQATSPSQRARVTTQTPGRPRSKFKGSCTFPPLCVSHSNRGLVWCRESEVTLTVAQHQNILHQHPAVRSHCGLDWSSFIVYSLLHFMLVSVLLSFSLLVLCGFRHNQELSVPVKPGETREGSSVGWRHTGVDISLFIYLFYRRVLPIDSPYQTRVCSGFVCL